VDDRIIAENDSGFALSPPDGIDVPSFSALGSSLSLPPDYDKIEIDYTAMSFSSPENVRFRYRMRGVDKEWVEAGSQRSAKYPRLAAGRYEFHVTACNDVGVWREKGASLTFVVRPFFWQTWWFESLIWLGAVALVTGVAVAVLRRRHHTLLRALERQRAIEFERARIARDMHDQLGSGLTKAGMLAEALRREAGEESSLRPRFHLLRETLERMTVTMDELVWAVNPRHDTLDGLANYVIRYTQEFLADTSITCVLDVPADLPAVSVNAPIRHNLFLAFEEALSNAARHAAATEVTVRVAFREGLLTLDVVDNGRGFTNSSLRDGAHGLENMRQRLSLIGGRCDVETAEGRGTRVRFELELQRGLATETKKAGNKQ
jgi:signal transduction histidine kinase